jgi:hypothetical protein
MIGLDDVVWSLALVLPATSPEERVLELLRVHMTGDMGFTRASVARKEGMFTSGLTDAIGAYFARPVPEDEVPPIDGDPFTNTQEYPTGFALGRAEIHGERATVPVRFDLAGRPRLVVAVLAKVSGSWRLDDLRYEDGSTFRTLLRPSPSN